MTMTDATLRHVLTASERAALPRQAQKALQDVDECKSSHAASLTRLTEPGEKAIRSHKQHSEIFPHICTGQLGARQVHQEVSTTIR